MRQTPSKARVLIVDDHPVVRHGFAQRIDLEADLEVCADVATAHEGLSQIAKLQPDVVLVDIALKEGDGLDLIKDLKARGDGARVLVVSGHDESVYAERCLRAGAHGYLQKDEAIDKIIEAIRRVIAGKVFLSNAITARTLDRIVSGKAEASGPPTAVLSDRELQVYELIGRGLTTAQIAEKLFLSPKTIESHRMNLKNKLKLKNGHELTCESIRWVLEQD